LVTAVATLGLRITVISLFLVARLLQGATLAVAAAKAAPSTMLSEFWVLRSLCLPIDHGVPANND
jgi:hypothetical protein